MKNINKLILLVVVLLLSCKTSQNSSGKSLESSTIEKWIIANKQVPCSEGSERLCYSIKKGSNGDYEIFEGVIEGFSYEPGYKYQLEIQSITTKKEGTKIILVKELFKLPMD
ncbi:MAG: DUF4377 domain-containing protein [Chitinophagales bacterium]|nr:DUF4377 domain-containing protein [Chitinophagales bacterium]